MSNHNNTATHVYGTFGIVCGAVGLAASFFGSENGLIQWLLYASGWLAAAFLAWYLVRTSRTLTDIIERHDQETAEASDRAARLEENLNDLQAEIDRRHSTLDYLSSLLMKGPAMPRRPAPSQDSHDPEEE